MTATEILIHDPGDLRPGDVLRVWPEKHPERWAEGPIWIGNAGVWVVGGRFLCYEDGPEAGQWPEVTFDLAAHPARRTVPPVDPAQVEALTDLLKASDDKDGGVFYSTLARRLLETGRVEVKP